MRDKLMSSFSTQGLINFLFLIIVFIVTRQVPFSFLSPVMNLCVIVIIVMTLSKVKPEKNKAAITFFLLVLPLSYQLFYSLVATDNQIILAVKFYIVLLSLGLAYFIKVDRSTLKWFIRICLIQVFVMVGIYVYIITNFDINSYLPLRLYFIEQGWGDVYTYDGIFYRIQIKGSALLVIALILNLELNLFKNKKLVTFLLLSGVIIAGNFAFLIALFIYVLYKIFSSKNNRTLSSYQFKVLGFIALIICALPYIYQYVVSTIERKNDNSLSLRGDQTKVLIDNLLENPFTTLMGQGLGNTLNIITSSRDYTDSIYFEIQILYILNQLGVVFFICFIFYNILIMIFNWGRSHNKEIYLTYLIYIIYAVTNPYIFDTNHLIVIIVLNSWNALKKKTNEQQYGINHSALSS